MENASIISRLMRRPSSWWHQFRTWQRTPISVAPLRDEQHVCLNCGDSFDGNFCPRCGQDAKTKRFTLRGAFLHMIDVWGLGTQGMLRTLWHLFWRPGYMILDYLRGRRQSYFSPFKTVFVLAALTFVIAQMLPGEMIHADKVSVNIDRAPYDEKMGTATATAEKLKEGMAHGIDNLNYIIQWQEDHYAFSVIIGCLLLTLTSAMFFRRPPTLPNATIVEHFYINVLINCQVLVVSLFYLFGRYALTGTINFSMPTGVSVIIYTLDYWQVYGHTFWGTLWRSLLSFFFYSLFMLLAIVLYFLIIGVMAAI